MKRVLFVSLVLLGGTACAQQFPISANNMFSSSNQSFEENEINTTPGMMKSANFNWGIAITTDPTEINNLLTAAAINNISLILEGVIPDYGWAERLYFEAGENNMYFSTVKGQLSQIADPNSDQPNDSYYDRKSLQATAVDSYMVEGVNYDPVDPWVDSASYTAYFRLKVQKSPDPPPPTTPVVSIEVWDTQNTPNTLIASEVLTYSQFASSNVYYSDSLTFMPPHHPGSSSPSSTNGPVISEGQGYFVSPSRMTSNASYWPDNIDLRVYWYGNVPTWLDDIRVESTDGKTDFSPPALFAGQYNSQIKNDAQQYDTYTYPPARYYLKDEPYISQYLAYAYLNTVLDSVQADHSNGKGLGYTQKDEGAHLHDWTWPGDTYKRFLQESHPYELAAEVNRFLNGDAQPGAPGYTNSTAQPELQMEMARFDSAEADCYLSQSGTWRAHINSSSWINTTREPHTDEIRAQVYCALAHGAKGIDYFDYISSPAYGDTGLVDTSLVPIRSNSYGEDKWDSVAAINKNIGTYIGPVIMQSGFTWQAAYSDTGQTNGYYGPYISSISTYPYDADTTYVEIGEFTDVSGNRYFMLVNRRTSPWDTRNITVNFSLGSGSWYIADVSSGNSWVIPYDGNFTDSFNPGEGKLYKVVPANFASALTVPSGGKMTVSSGTTLSFASGTSLTINGTITATGAAFTASSGEWNGIVINANGSALTNCTI